MVRVKVARAVLLDDGSAAVEAVYARAVNQDGRITSTAKDYAHAAVLTERQAEQVARYYRRFDKPGRISYEGVFAHAAD